MDIDLSVPIWTIEHVAAALHLEVDTAREHAYTAAFPAPRAGFARNLWLRGEVLAWFAALPAGERRRGEGRRETTTSATVVKGRPAASAGSAAASSSKTTTARTARPRKSYKPGSA